MELTPSYYKDQTKDMPSSPTKFRNWYNQVIFEFEEKEYLFTFTLSRLGETAHSLIQFVEGPLVLKEKVNERNQAMFDGQHPLAKYQEIQSANIEYFHDDQGKYKADDLLEEDMGDKGFVVSLDVSKFVYLPKGRRVFTVDSERIRCDLTFTPRGPALWWGNEPFAKAPLDPTIACTGTEELCTVEGTVTYEGKELKVVNGKGLSEHVWIPEMDWMLWRYMDWTWFHTEEMYGLLYRGDMKNAYHYEWGGIYIEQDKKLSYCKSVKYTHKKLAWSPEHLRFIPVEQELVAETEDGILKASLKGIMKPPVRPGVFLPDYVSDGLQGWVFTFWSIVYEITGSFTYNDGRVLNLTPGRGVNEPQVVAPIT